MRLALILAQSDLAIGDLALGAVGLIALVAVIIAVLRKR